MNSIKEVHNDHGPSQKWLAERIGKSINTINAYVQNRIQLSSDVLKQISTVLGVNLKKLIND